MNSYRVGVSGVIREGENGLSPCSLSLPLIFLLRTPAFLSFSRGMCAEKSSGSVYLQLGPSFSYKNLLFLKPSLSRRDNLLSPETTCNNEFRGPCHARFHPWFHSSSFVNVLYANLRYVRAFPNNTEWYDIGILNSLRHRSFMLLAC